MKSYGKDITVDRMVSQGQFNSVAIGAAMLDAERGILRLADGTEATLRPKTADMLLLLLSRPGRLVRRVEILDHVWAGLSVTDDSVTQCVSELRRALGPDAGLLKTLPRRGVMLDIAPARTTGFVPTAARDGGVPVVAMLPLRLPVAEPALSGFADAILEGVVGCLARLREPLVISANSTRHFADAMPPLAEIGQRLGARYIASGSLRRAGDQLRVSIELADAENAAVLWHRAYNLKEEAGFAAEDMIAAVIAHSLAPRVQQAELRRGRRQTSGDRAAYHLLLEARHLIFRMERAALEEAGAMLRRVIAMDPGLASAQVTLANWYSLRLGQGWSPNREADARGLGEAVEAALALDSDNARALALLGHNQTILHRRYDAALALFERALDAAPNDAEVWLWSSPTFAFMGEAPEALRRAERAIQLSPEDPLLFRHQHFMALAHYARGDYAAALEWGRRSNAANPHYVANLRTMMASMAALGQHDAARELRVAVMALEPEFRVGPMIASHAMSDPERRRLYETHLLQAGLPA